MTAWRFIRPQQRFNATLFAVHLRCCLWLTHRAVALCWRFFSFPCIRVPSVSRYSRGGAQEVRTEEGTQALHVRQALNRMAGRSMGAGRGCRGHLHASLLPPPSIAAAVAGCLLARALALSCFPPFLMFLQNRQLCIEFPLSLSFFFLLALVRRARWLLLCSVCREILSFFFFLSAIFFVCTLQPDPTRLDSTRLACCSPVHYLSPLLTQLDNSAPLDRRSQTSDNRRIGSQPTR